MHIPITVYAPSGLTAQTVPVRAGLPLPKGYLRVGEDLEITSESGDQVTHQQRVLERWIDGTAKWVLLDCLHTVSGAKSTLYAKRSEPVGKGPSAAIERSPDLIKVSMGESVCEVDAAPSGSLMRIRQGTDDKPHSLALSATLTDKRGQHWSGNAVSQVVEDAGPVSVRVVLSGSFANRGRTLPLRFEAIIEMFPQCSTVFIDFDLWNPRAAAHPGNVWDLGDPSSFLFRDLTLAVASDSPFRSSSLSADGSGIEWADMPEEWQIYQDSSGGENWQSKNHVGADGESTVSFRGYTVRDRTGNVLSRGERANPQVVVEVTAGGTIAAQVDGFWQNFPKAIRLDERSLEVGLFPREARRLHELQGGERKRHRFALQLAETARQGKRQVGWARPVRGWADPRSIETSAVLPWFAVESNSEASASCRDFVSTIISGPLSFAARREVIDEYGWRNFGDLYADHEAVHESYEGECISHYNNQYDFVYGAALNGLRSRDEQWMRLMEDAARHHIDIDVYHTELDRPDYNGGLFWHTEHYRSAGTSTHRTYSRENRISSGYGGGPSNEHNYTSGLTVYYLLSGDSSAKRTVVGLADWVIQMDDGAGTIWGVIDAASSTGLASKTVSLDYHGPGRGGGNSINALLDAYSLTADRKYMVKADELLQRCVHPCDDITSLDLDDPERRWSYLVFLQILGKYLWCKQQLEEHDYSYCYASESLLHYARWMVANEVPFSEVLDKVEIPTETWPAQDIRKAHILYISSAFAKGKESKDMFEKAEFYFRRCLDDLLSFETAYLCRPRVILAVYGSVRDFFVRSDLVGPLAGSPVERYYDFGEPGTFRPQRQNLGGALRGRLRAVTFEIWRHLGAPTSAALHRLKRRLLD